MERPLTRLKQQYMATPIPRELDAVVMKAVQSRKRPRRFIKVAAVAAALVIGFGISVNVSPALAQALEGVPVLGSVVRVITIRAYSFEDTNFHADITVPVIENLNHDALEEHLNAQYLSDAQRLYEEFTADMETMKAAGGGHLSVDSGYIVKTDTEQLLSVGRYVVKAMASASDDLTYTTIDKQNKLLITLPMLFRDESYIAVISENITQQMQEQMAAGEGKMYWLPGSLPDDTQTFKSIAADQDFYISTEGKLVISFDKYAVGPGVMGVVEFTIPTEIITDELVSDEYIR